MILKVNLFERGREFERGLRPFSIKSPLSSQKFSGLPAKIG
jgi:hypothetical protein